MSILDGGEEEEGAAGCEVSRSTEKGTWRRAAPCCGLCKQHSALNSPLWKREAAARSLWELPGEVLGNNRHYKRRKNSNVYFVEEGMPRIACPLARSPEHFLRNQEGFVARRSLSGRQTDERALPHPALQLPKLSLTIFCISDV